MRLLVAVVVVLALSGCAELMDHTFYHYHNKNLQMHFQGRAASAHFSHKQAENGDANH